MASVYGKMRFVVNKDVINTRERVPSPFCEKNYRIWQSRQVKTGKSAPVLTLTN